MQGHIVLQEQGAGQEGARRHNDDVAARRGAGIDRLLDGGRAKHVPSGLGAERNYTELGLRGPAHKCSNEAKHA